MEAHSFLPIHVTQGKKECTSIEKKRKERRPSWDKRKERKRKKDRRGMKEKKRKKRRKTVVSLDDWIKEKMNDKRSNGI